MSQLSFFIPVDLKQNSLSGLAEGYFAYGQSRARLQPGSRAVDLRHCPQPLWKTALKVISLATLILPSAFLMVKVWHRWTHTYTYTPSNQILAKGIGAIEDRDRVPLTIGSEGSTYRLPHHEDLIFFMKQPLWTDVVALEDKRRELGFNKLLPPTCGLHGADTVVYKEPLISVLQEQEAIFEQACEEDYTDALTELFHYIVKCNVGFVDQRAPIYAHQGKIKLGLTKLSEDVQGTLIDIIWTVNEQQAEHLLTLAQNHFGERLEKKVRDAVEDRKAHLAYLERVRTYHQDHDITTGLEPLTFQAGMNPQTVHFIRDFNEHLARQERFLSLRDRRFYTYYPEGTAGEQVRETLKALKDKGMIYGFNGGKLHGYPEDRPIYLFYIQA